MVDVIEKLKQRVLYNQSKQNQSKVLKYDISLDKEAADEIKSLRRQVRDLKIDVEDLKSEIWSREDY